MENTSLSFPVGKLVTPKIDSVAIAALVDAVMASLPMDNSVKGQALDAGLASAMRGKGCADEVRRALIINAIWRVAVQIGRHGNTTAAATAAGLSQDKQNGALWRHAAGAAKASPENAGDIARELARQLIAKNAPVRIPLTEAERAHNDAVRATRATAKAKADAMALGWAPLGEDAQKDKREISRLSALLAESEKAAFDAAEAAEEEYVLARILMAQAAQAA